MNAAGRDYVVTLGMTLGEVIEKVESNPVACGCIGPPRGCTECYCVLIWKSCVALKRAAHITIKMISQIDEV